MQSLTRGEAKRWRVVEDKLSSKLSFMNTAGLVASMRHETLSWKTQWAVFYRKEKHAGTGSRDVKVQNGNVTPCKAYRER